MGSLQSFDISLGLAPNEEKTLPDAVYDGFSIKSAEIEKVYGAGGSQATIELIYIDDVEPGTAAQLCEREYQPNMEIRIEQSHYEPASERPEAPGNVEDIFPRNEIVANSIPGDVTATDVFGSNLRVLSNTESQEQARAASSSFEPDLKEPAEGIRQVVFTGKPIRMVGNPDGVIKLKLLDNRLVLNRNYVRLDLTRYSEQPTWLEILKDLVENELGFKNIALQDYSPEVARGNKIFTVEENVLDEFSSPLKYGLEEPATLFQVLSDIAVRTGAHFWIDRFNNFRFQAFPGSKQYVPEYVTDIEAGNEDDPNNVLVSSPFDDTGVEFFGGTTSQTVEGSVEFNEDLPDRNLEKTNIGSAQEAEATALGALLTDQLSRNYGTITVLGSPSLNVYDGIVLSVMPDLTPIQNGLYTSKVVRHVINGDDGFVTEIELGDSIPKMYNKLAQSNQEAAKRNRFVKGRSAYQVLNDISVLRKEVTLRGFTALAEDPPDN